MQAQKEAPPDLQCKDKFLLQSVIANEVQAAKDITSEMVSTLHTDSHLWFCAVCNITDD